MIIMSTSNERRSLEIGGSVALDLDPNRQQPAPPPQQPPPAAPPAATPPPKSRQKRARVRSQAEIDAQAAYETAKSRNENQQKSAGNFMAIGGLACLLAIVIGLITIFFTINFLTTIASIAFLIGIVLLTVGAIDKASGVYSEKRGQLSKLKSAANNFASHSADSEREMHVEPNATANHPATGRTNRKGRQAARYERRNTGQ
jgi:hypothetical protein